MNKVAQALLNNTQTRSSQAAKKVALATDSFAPWED